MKYACLFLLATVALAEVPDSAKIDGVSMELSQLTISFPRGPAIITAVNICVDGAAKANETLSISLSASILVITVDESNPSLINTTTTNLSTNFQAVPIGDKRCGVGFLQVERQKLQNLQVGMNKVLQFAQPSSK